MTNAEITMHEFRHMKANKDLIHGVFTRAGGSSTEPFDSLNIGINSGDEHSAIAENRKKIIWKMGMKPLVFLNQTHGDKIQVLKKEDNDLSEIFEPGKEAYTADGIVTDMPGIFLVIQVADCQAVLLYDPIRKVVANVHSGWRGSIKNIIGRCLDVMVKEFECNPKDILAGISPSLGPCCAEFIHYEDEIPESLWKYKKQDVPYFDFWQLSLDQMMEKGIKKANVENMRICTKCHVKEFYSYRAEKTTGRFACVISMK